MEPSQSTPSEDRGTLGADNSQEFSFLTLFKKLYSPETLDTRFMQSNSGTHKSTGSTRGLTKPLPKPLQLSKWKTLEYRFYVPCVAALLIWMTKQVVDVSKSSHPNYPRFAPLLSRGWLFGQRLDNSDGQFSSFRDNLPYLLLVLILHPILRSICFGSGWPFAHSVFNKPTTPETRLKYRTRFDFVFGLLFILALHGSSAFKIFTILWVNYEIGRFVPQKYIVFATWTTSIAILFANEIWRGYPLAFVAESILPRLFRGVVHRGVRVYSWGELLDMYQGLMPRWELLFKFTILRLISFNLDYYWSLKKSGEKRLQNSELSDSTRVVQSAHPENYSFVTYVAYALYSPLYLAGPIITFNDYIAQNRIQAPSISRSRTFLYALRFLIALLSMEIFIHYVYVVAIFKANTDWSQYTPFQLSMLGFFNLIHIWLKLLLPWRFFRLWALMDGIDAPENMVRCVSNNYSALAFWRGWHRSYNRWVMRYIYVPMGGSQAGGLFGGRAKMMFNYLVVFTFVAIWHDIQLRLLQWGGLITFFVLPEVLGKMAFPQSKWDPEKYRILAGIGAVFNIWLMIVANLVGFAIGLDGIKDLLAAIVGSYTGFIFVIGSIFALFVGTQLMFEIRESELRAGILLKC